MHCNGCVFLWYLCSDPNQLEQRLSFRLQTWSTHFICLRLKNSESTHLWQALFWWVWNLGPSCAIIAGPRFTYSHFAFLLIILFDGTKNIMMMIVRCCLFVCFVRSSVDMWWCATTHPQHFLRFFSLSRHHSATNHYNIVNAIQINTHKSWNKQTNNTVETAISIKCDNVWSSKK